MGISGESTPVPQNENAVLECDAVRGILAGGDTVVDQLRSQLRFVFRLSIDRY